MTGYSWVTIYLGILFIAHIDDGLADTNAREVTFWDVKYKKIHYDSSTVSVVSEYIDKNSCSSKGGDNTLVDWGLTIPDGSEGVTCSDGDECVDYGVAKVVITYEGSCERVHWTASNLTELKDCVYLRGHWYGGGQQFTEPWPIETNPKVELAFVSEDMIATPWKYGGLSERYWISSEGIALRVENSIPLFLSLPDSDSDGIADMICLSSRNEEPFVADSVDSPVNLTYHLCYADDVRQVYESSYPKFFSYPRDIPDERMITHPIWSTWAQYHTDVNDSRVIALAQTIKDYGFNNSQIEIDDNWETCYGDAIFNPERFTDPKGMVDILHSMGYRVTLWIHPFINDDCESFTFADQNGFFIKNESGQTQLTSWWQGKHSGIIDFTNGDAVTWWSSRLDNLKQETGIDSFKFDAGEVVWLPKTPFVLNLEKQFWPNGYTTSYVNAVTNFGSLIEVRVGYDTQEDPIFVRMLDKDSRWSEQNGLRTLIPSLLHSGILGYAFSLPDMVGGNAYEGKPSSELFIRWAQANTFMPSIQYSLLPWEFDDGVFNATQTSLDVSALHEQYSPLIIELARNVTLGLGPMMRPTWWLCPTDEDCLLADQQFLLGDDILVTPVMEEGATFLDVVFPPGSWRQSDTGDVYNGPSKQTLSDITIDSNIYFERV